MSIIESILLGLIQGLTEFIPISSSGHLVIAQHIFNGASDHLFLEWINIGTVLALMIFFRKRILEILRSITVGRDYRLAINLLIATVPAGAIGFFLADFIENTAFFGSVWTVVATLSILGVIMVVLEKLPKLQPVKDATVMPKKRALTIGLAQVAALIPGTSRSGSTIIAGRLMGLNSSQAAEFSFLVSIPIMLGVLLKLVISADDRLYFAANMPELIIGNLAALVSGLVAVGFLMNYLRKHSLAFFGWYRIILAAIIAVVLLFTVS